MKFCPWRFIYPVIYFPFFTQTTTDRKTPPRAAPLSENTSLEDGILLRQCWLEKTRLIFITGKCRWAVSLADVNLGISSDTIGVTVTLHCFEAWPICVSYQF